MTAVVKSFWDVAISLWLRLVTLAVLGLLFASLQFFPEMVGGWRFYQTDGEVVFGVVVRLVFLALCGVALATLLTALVAPFLLDETSRQRRAWTATRAAVALVAFADLSIVARISLQPLVRLAGLLWFPTTIVYCIAFAIAMLIPRGRRQIVTSLDGLLTEKATRRTALTTGVASAGLVAAEFAMGKAAAFAIPSVAAAPRTSRGSGRNILMVTFDSLSADDMSLYGYRLPTTPCIDAFARTGSVFTNAYSSSTFTTPSAATLVSGLYPSEHRVYHIDGRLAGEHRGRTLPGLMRAAGYSTAASTSSPYVYCLLDALGTEYDFLPDPPYRTGGFDWWRATALLHQRQPYGSRNREFMDSEVIRDYPANHFARYSPGLFGRSESGFAPAANFDQALDTLKLMPDGFFLWVHLFAPHGPYFPDAPWLGRFLPAAAMGPYDQGGNFWPFYKPELQARVNKIRLRYDEFISQADQAFGSFLAAVEGSGRLRDTAVIVAADHGDSFEGGLLGHGSQAQTRGEIHIPLVIRMPGQQQGRRVEVAVDGTCLAPTVLEIAGLARPDWMRGQSLAPWLATNSAPPEPKGLAFTQYLAKNRIFEPVHSGSVGVIDGANQYVVNLATGKGMLRGVSETQAWDLDHSTADPALAQAMRKAIYSRFPNLPGNQT